jgi:predicted dehydrogenase
MTKKLSIALAGAGNIGQAHMAVAHASPTVALCAIVDPHPAAQQWADHYQIPRFESLEALLTTQRPDGIVLATPNQLHAAHARTCMDAGIPILLEKPITPTLAEARALVAYATEKNAKVLIGHHRAHSPIMAKAKVVVESGQLGKIVAVMGSATFLKPDHYFVEGAWRTQPGGGPLLLNMIHEVHNLRLLCGEIVAVQAFVSNAVRNFAVEDTASITLKFASGALGTFLLSDAAASARSWEQTSHENKAYPTYKDEDCYVISGTNGTLSIPTMRLKTYPRNEDRSWWKPFEEGVVGIVRDDPLKHQMEHFGAVIRGETAPQVSARDGMMNLQVVEAIVEAGRTGSTVFITH